MNKNKFTAVVRRNTKNVLTKKDSEAAQDTGVIVTEKPTSGIKKTLESRLSDLCMITGISGLVSGVDFLFMGSGYAVDNPFGALAVGSGATLGTQFTNRNWGRVYTSLSTLLLSLCPEIHTLSNDSSLYNFTTGVVMKTLAYGAGFATITVLDFIISNIKSTNDHSAVFDVEADFNSEIYANNVYQMLNDIILSGGDAVSTEKSKVSMPLKTGENYKVTARIVGKYDDLEHNLQPSIEEYLTKISPVNYNVSNVISTQSFDYDNDDATFDIVAEYGSEDKAKRAYSFLNNIISNEDSSISDSEKSTLKGPRLDNNMWKIDAIIFGDSEEVRRLRADIEEYLQESGVVNLSISSVVRSG